MTRVPGWFLKRPPYAVQVEALRRSKDKEKFGFFMEQGLGKTGTDLNDTMLQLDQDRIDASVVIAPNYLLSGWEDEIAVWGVDLPVVTWPAQVPDKIAKRPHIFLMNIEATIYSGGDYVDGLLGQRRYKLTIDESSCIKQHNGKWTDRVLKWREQTSIRRLLSGTPMPYGVMDLWSQFRMLGELSGTDAFAFRNRFAQMGGYMGKQVVGIQTDKEKEIHRLFERCSFRALKEDWWADMPEKIYPPPVMFDMSKRQIDAYRTMNAEMYALVKESEENDYDDAVFAHQVTHKLMKLQQISRGFMIDKDNDRVVELVDSKSNPAIRTLKSLLESTRGKTIVAVHHTHSLKTLYDALQDWHPVVLRGGLTKDEIAQRKAAFNGDPKTRVLLGQIDVTHKGHTLLGGPGDDRCSTTIHYESTYNLEHRLQIEDRNHRFGQDKAVVYLDMACSAQDVKVITALQQRRHLVRAVVDAMRARPK